MKKSLGVIQKALAAIGIMIVVAIAATYFLLDSAVKSAIETIVSEVTRTKGVIGDLELSTVDGIGRISDFRISNPDGFESKEAFRSSEIKIEIDVTTLTSDVVRIKKIEVIKPEITYERTDKDSNIETIGVNAQNYMGKGDKAVAKGETEASKAGPGTKSVPKTKFVIDNIYLTDGAIKLAAPFFGQDKAKIPLPNLHMENIGQGDGASPAEITQYIVSRLAVLIGSAVGAVNIMDLLSDIVSLSDTVSAFGPSRKAIGEADQPPFQRFQQPPFQRFQLERFQLESFRSTS